MALTCLSFIGLIMGIRYVMNSHLVVNPWAIFEFSTTMDLVSAAHAPRALWRVPHFSLATPWHLLLTHHRPFMSHLCDVPRRR